MKSNGINIEVHARRPWSGEASSVLWEGKAPPRMRSAEGPAEIQACLSCTREDCSGNICPRADAARRADQGKGLTRRREGKINRLPIPTDFTEVFAGRTYAWTAKYYGVSPSTVRNWALELGV